jgi:hypothetical protein
MNHAILRFPIQCPCCGAEILAESRVAELIGAFAHRRPLRFHAPCHDQDWSATALETDQVREYLRAVWLDRFTPTRFRS